MTTTKHPNADPDCERCGGTGSEYVEPGPDCEAAGSVPCACIVISAYRALHECIEKARPSSPLEQMAELGKWRVVAGAAPMPTGVPFVSILEDVFKCIGCDENSGPLPDCPRCGWACAT